MALSPFDYGTNQVDAKSDPDQGDGNINGPFQFRIFLGTSVAQRKRNGCRYNDGLPAPEIEIAQQITEHTGLKQSLTGIIDPCKNGVPHKGKDDGIGVERA